MSLNNSPNFSQFVSIIYKKAPLQRKAVQSFLENQDSVFWQRAEHFAEKIISLLEKQNLSIEYVVDSYLNMCWDMLIEQIKFRKTGRYSFQTAAQAEAHVYSSEKEMASYMYGLALSYFLWPNHYSMYDFFISESKKIENVESYMEIGPGHGLFLVASIYNFPDAKFEAIDISPISKRISGAIVTHFTESSKCDFQVKDVNHIQSGKYDYIVMCEVLEHLDDPLSVMKKFRSLLSESGRFFITTCANCPAIDHVYLYDSVDHIRREIKEAGFEILTDLPLSVGDFPESEWYEKKVEINYAAMLMKV